LTGRKTPNYLLLKNKQTNNNNKKRRKQKKQKINKTTTVGTEHLYTFCTARIKQRSFEPRVCFALARALITPSSFVITYREESQSRCFAPGKGFSRSLTATVVTGRSA